jgi:hypothetical protein
MEPLVVHAVQLDYPHSTWLAAIQSVGNGILDRHCAPGRPYHLEGRFAKPSVTSVSGTR